MSKNKKTGLFKSSVKPGITLVYNPDVPQRRLPGVKVDKNVYVEMRDSIKLCVDIYRPENDGRYPALLSMAPYLKEVQQYHPGLSHSIEAGATSFYVARGYVHVICQARGSGLSQGKWGFLDNKEQEDGYDMVEWIAGQSWCNGNVGLIGDSYWAWIQYLIAAQKPPHLKCIAPHDGGADLYRDTFYQGGIFNAGEFANHWIVDSMFQCVWPGSIEGKLAPTNLAADLASNPDDGPYYWERSAWTKADSIEVPVLFCVARTNLHSRSQLAMYPKIKSPKKLLVEPPAGPWAHLHFLTNRALNEYLLKWYDYWLKGKDNGIMNEPEVAIFDSITQEWRYENEYPLKRTHWTKLYLSGPGETRNEQGRGLLSVKPPLNEEPDRYAVPQSTELLLAGKPVLTYATAPLEKDMQVWGPISITFFGSSSVSDTAWFVKMMDIGLDNKARMVSKGVLRASYRGVEKSQFMPGQPFHPFQNPVPLEPNAIYEFQIEMDPIFNTFKSGHRICLDIASDDLTYFGSLHTLDIQRLPLPSENAIYHDPSHPSHLLLPVVPDAPKTDKVPPPVADIKWSLNLERKWPQITGEWSLY